MTKEPKTELGHLLKCIRYVRTLKSTGFQAQNRRANPNQYLRG
jgi:hypothetical protein